MRVIAGQYRGKGLKGPRGTELRPTSNRLRQTLFDILGARVSGSRFLDAFAGTGAVGIEALSRGAGAVVFIESDPAACRLIRENLRICGITGGYRLLEEDVFKSLRRLAREGSRFDLAFLDPPYHWGPYADLLDLLFSGPLAGKDALAVCEHHGKARLPAESSCCRRVRVVAQGDKRLSFYAAAG